MISMTHISSGAGASQYLIEQAEVEYYSDKVTPSAWHGEGARIQGMSGQEVTAKELTAQLDGKVWSFDGKNFDRVQLGTMRTDKEAGEIGLQHRAGWDFTFSAPKSVSIESEVFGHDDVRAAHEQAVQKAMGWLEQNAAQARIHGERVDTGNLTYGTFQHATSRAGDPQTHTHVVIANVTYDEQGKAYSLSNEKLLQMRTTCDAVYKMELANSLQQLGYQVDFDRKGNFEIAGYSKEDLETFSKRSEQIIDKLQEQGIDPENRSFQSKERATLETRPEKTFSNASNDYRDKWQAERPDMKEAVRGEVTITRAEQLETAKEAVKDAISHLAEREAAFTAKDVWQAATRFAEGNTTADHITDAIKAQEKAGELIKRDDGKYTTQTAIDAVNYMVSKLEAGKDAHISIMTTKEFDKALNDFESRKTAEMIKSGQLQPGEEFKLGKDQISVAEMILTNKDRYLGTQGYAGTGKTTVLEFVREAAESKGWEVQGMSNGGAQADKMEQESGIKTTTTARFLIEHQKAEKDANLASRALATYEKQKDSMFSREPNFEKLARNKSVTMERDSEGRKFYTTKDGETFTPSLYEKTNQVFSKNINHLGLTETEYRITDKGVFKTGGSLINEMAGALKDKLNESRAETTFGKVAQWAGNKLLTESEGWQKCGRLEATAVKMKAAWDTDKNRSAEVSALKEQACSMSGENRKVLYLMDEASMSGQREMNGVINATERTGSKLGFLGDLNQRQAIEAEKSFEIAQNHMTMSELGADSIQRQKTDHMKLAVKDIVEGRHAEAIEKLNTKEFTSKQEGVRQDWSERLGDKPMTEKQERAFKADMKEAEKADNKEVINAIAKDYSSLEKGDREKTLIITATNADRNELNSTIRNELKAKGELSEGKTMDTLEKTGLTDAEKRFASSYEKGQVIEFSSELKRYGVEKGDQFTIERVESKTNTIFATKEDGQKIAFDPERIKGFEAYNKGEAKEFSQGDRMTFTKNETERLDVKNGQTGTVEKFDGKTMTVLMDNKDRDGNEIRKTFDAKDYAHVDHAYAMTSHKSQGQTYDNVIVHHNTTTGHGDRETYVNVTRARLDCTIYSQSTEKLESQVGRELSKETAYTKADKVQDAAQEKGDKNQSKETAKEAPESTRKPQERTKDKDEVAVKNTQSSKAEEKQDKQQEVSRTEQPNSSGKENRDIRQRQQMDMSR